MATNPKIRYDIEAAVTGAGDVNALAAQLEGLANTLEGDLKVQAQASAQALRELGAKQGAIDNFRALKTEVTSASAQLKDAQAAAQKLGASLSASSAPTRAQAGQMEKLRDAVRSAKAELQAQTLALDKSRASLAAYGVSSTNVAAAERSTRAALASARTEVQALAPAYTAAGNAAAASGAKQVAAANSLNSGLSGVGAQLRNIQNIAAAAIGGTFLTSLGRDLASVADEYNNLAARIKLVTGEGAAFDAAFQGVQQIALATNSELEATGTLFARIAQAGKELGISQQAALSLTQTINQAVQLSGGSAEGARAAIVQLVQGLQSGVLRGEEFNSVMEQSPRLAQALAAGLGKTTGELRAMAQQGQLTTDVVLRALRSQSAAVSEEFAKLPPTVGRAIQNLSSAWTLYIGEADAATGASAAAAGAINLVAQNLDTLIDVATRAGAVVVAALGVQAVGALRAYIASTTAAAGATSLLSLEMSKVPKLLQITVALAGFEAAYQFGTYLRENSQLAREFGVQFVNFIETQVNSLTFLKEAATAVFTDDTIDAALERYNQRAEQQRSIIAEMMKDAEQAPAAIEAASQRAAVAVQQIGDAAKETSVNLANLVKDAEAARIAKVADTQAAEANLRVQLQLAQQSEELARYLGNETEVRKAKILQMEIEIRLIEAKVAVSRAEAEGTIAVAQAKLDELAVSKEVDKVKRAELESSIKLAQAKLAEADATGRSTELLQRQLEALRKGSVDAGSAAVQSMNDAAAATRNVGTSAQQAAQGYNDLARSAEDAAAAVERAADAERKRRGVDKQGFSADADGNRIVMASELKTLTGIANFLKQAGLTEEQAKQLALEFSDGQGNIPYVNNPGQLKYGGRYGSMSTALLKAAEKITFAPPSYAELERRTREEQEARQAAAAETSSSRGAPGAGGYGGSARSVNVTINTPSGQRRVSTNEQGAKDLVEALRIASMSANR